MDFSHMYPSLSFLVLDVVRVHYHKFLQMDVSVFTLIIYSSYSFLIIMRPPAVNSQGTQG
jgi:hypothetical protein